MNHRAFLEENGVPRTAISEIVMPKYRQTANNIGFAWVVMNDVSQLNHFSRAISSRTPRFYARNHRDGRLKQMICGCGCSRSW